MVRRGPFSHWWPAGASLALAGLGLCLLWLGLSWLLPGRLAAPSAALAAEPVSEAIGRRVPPLLLKDTSGKLVSLADFDHPAATVVAFLGTACPVSNRYLPALAELAERYDNQHVQFVAVYSSPADSAERVAEHVREFDIKIPCWLDGEQQLLLATGATHLSEVAVIDPRGAIRYLGRIDDRFGVDHQREKARRSDLQVAIEELLAGKEVSVPQTTPSGCVITRRRVPTAPIAAKDDKASDEKATSEKATAAGKINYTADVAPILRAKCEQCHHEGGAAPFALATPDDAVDWSAMIKQVVLERRMPPWHADARYGKFLGDLSLSAQEIATIAAWVDGDLALGDVDRLPPAREFSDGWNIGKPDIVFDLPEEVQVPAEGVVPYLRFEMPTNFDEDVWIQAAEARPDNRAVVHHIVVYYVPPDGSKERRNEQWVAGTAPGDMALVLPPGMAQDSRALDAALGNALHAQRQAAARSLASGAGAVSWPAAAEVQRAHVRHREPQFLRAAARCQLSGLCPDDVAARFAAVEHDAAHAPAGQRLRLSGHLSRRPAADASLGAALRLRLAKHLSPDRATITAQGNQDRVRGPLRQFGGESGQSRPRRLDPLWRTNLGRNDDRLHRLHVG